MAVPVDSTTVVIPATVTLPAQPQMLHVDLNNNTISSATVSEIKSLITAAMTNASPNTTFEVDVRPLIAKYTNNTYSLNSRQVPKDPTLPPLYIGG